MMYVQKHEFEMRQKSTEKTILWKNWKFYIKIDQLKWMRSDPWQKKTGLKLWDASLKNISRKNPQATSNTQNICEKLIIWIKSHKLKPQAKNI